MIKLLLALLFASSTAVAAGPAEAIKTAIKEVRLKVSEHTEQSNNAELDKELRGIISPLFDFREMSRRSLGQSWKTANAAQQKEFIELFSDLLSDTYLARIRDNVAESKVKFLKERIKNDKAIITTKVIAEEQEATISYRLRNKNDKWVIYDVVIENVGLVSNYRQEFAELVQDGGMELVLEKLRAKKVELKAASAAA